MATLDTGDLTLPDTIIDPWLAKVAQGSTVAALVPAAPQTYGTETAMTFSIGEAEYVGEGANKAGSTVTVNTKTVKPFKFQKTVRMTEEVQWADEDKQLGVVAAVLDEVTPALSRALDFGVYHGINPNTGLDVTAMNGHLSETTNAVEVASQASYELIDAADLLVIADGYAPTDIAVETSFAGTFSTARSTEGVKLHPEFRLTTEVSTLEAHRASVSNTVGAIGVADTDTDVKAFVGDFSTIRWGVQRNIGIELIRYGDPDGGGDLKRNNQVAFRLEVLYGWGIFDLDAIAKIIDAV